MNLMDFFIPKSATYYLSDTSTIRQALEKFDAHKFTVVPLLTAEGDYISTVSVGDILSYIKNEARFDLSAAESVRVRDIPKYHPYRACRLSESNDEILQLALEQNFIPLVDDRNKYMGFVKRKAILATMIGRVREMEAEKREAEK